MLLLAFIRIIRIILITLITLITTLILIQILIRISVVLLLLLLDITCDPRIRITVRCLTANISVRILIIEMVSKACLAVASSLMGPEPDGVAVDLVIMPLPVEVAATTDVGLAERPRHSTTSYLRVCTLIRPIPALTGSLLTFQTVA